jgi:hypothetical protein
MKNKAHLSPLGKLAQKLAAASPAEAAAVGPTHVYARAGEIEAKRGRRLAANLHLLIRQTPTPQPGLRHLRSHLAGVAATLEGGRLHAAL